MAPDTSERYRQEGTPGPRWGRLALGAALVLVAAHAAGAVPFGRNKVQYDTFDWRVLRTANLDIHYYPEVEELAHRAADYGEEACERLSRELDHELTKRIPVILYGSHYHFRQNNVLPGAVGETTGGFTELFRTRVVLPYAGSEGDFRHVLHHELVHAFVFDRLYGGSITSLFLRQYAFHIPLWFMEGIAEFYSNEWDSEGEMMLRDAAVQGGLPPFPAIHGGYFVYKAGASAVGYLTDRHGREVIRKVLDELILTRDLRVALKNVTGEDLETLGADWHLEMKRRTWPTLAELTEAEEVGRVLASAGSGAMDSHPVLSPDGTSVVFLSTRSGTPDLWVADTDAESGRGPRVLVRGARGGRFESLHPLRSSVGWSPDGQSIVAAAQKGARDALYVLDAANGRVRSEHTPELDTLERPDWAADGSRFVFTGMRGGQVDLWTLDADGSGLTALTHDLFEERAPRWSPDGARVLFTSDRFDSTGSDLFTVDVRTGSVEPLVVRDGDQWDGCWTGDGQAVVYVTDEWGTRDLVSHDLVTGERRRVTRLLGGADSPSIAREGGQLAFTAYERGSLRLVLVDDPDTMAAVSATPVPVGPEFWPPSPRPKGAESPIVTVPNAPLITVEPLPDSAPAVTGPSETARGEGAIVVADALPSAVAESTEPVAPEQRAYDPRLRPEWMAGSLGYTGHGFSVGFRTTVTDVLGDHRISAAANLFRAVENTDAFVSYAYLRRRFDYGVAAFHFRDFLWDDRTTLGQPIGEEGDDARFSERQWGTSASISYPFHTFRRIELDVTAVAIERTRYESVDNRYREASTTLGTVLRPRLGHTFDNTLWGRTGPVQGARSIAFVQRAFPLDDGGVEFASALFDVRRYHRVGEYVIAMRAMASASWGADPQQVQLGGPSSIRGQARQSIRGRNAALLSIEYRYPFLDYVKFGWPLRSAFGGVRGDLFLDVGTAFDDPSRAKLTGFNEDGRRALRDLHVGFGVGARARVAFFPLRIDVGWPTDGISVGKPFWHFAIGPEF